MNQLGLIGFPLSHSHSPRLFAEFFRREGLTDWSYALFPRESLADLRSWLEDQTQLCGLNITIPHKTAVIPLLDRIHPAAAKTGAVNCVRIERAPTMKLIGYNTDTFGFSAMLDSVTLPENPKALILGTGGAARAVQYVLQERNIPYVSVGRNRLSADLLYEELNVATIADHPIIVQTTPLGMHGPWAGLMPALPYHAISDQHICLDLVYNPLITPFMARCSQQGATVAGGMAMLEAQAEAAWEIFKSDRSDETS